MSIETVIACAAQRRPLPDGFEAPVELTRRHGLGPLASALGARGFERDQIAASLLHEQLERTASEAAAALGAAGIPVMLIKGIASARRHYDDPSERPMTDIDVLVPQTAFADARRGIARLGYWVAGSSKERGRFHHAVTMKRPGAAIDVHRGIVQPLRRGSDIVGLWHRAQRSWLSYALVPDPVDEALITLAHIARHELAVRALSYVDAARMLATIDRSHLEARARRAHLSRPVEMAMAMTDALATNVWPGALEPLRADTLALRRPTRATQIWRKARLTDGPSDLLRLALNASLEALNF